MFDKIVEQNKRYDAMIYRGIAKENKLGKKLEREFMWDLKLIDKFYIDIVGRSTCPEFIILQAADDDYEAYKFEFKAPDSAGNLWVVDVNVSTKLALEVRPNLATEIQQWACAKLLGKEFRTEYDMEFHRKSLHY